MIAKEACEGLEGTDPSKIIGEARKNLYEGAPEEEIKEALILSSRSLVEIEPNYTFATARILLDSLRTEALSFLEVKDNATFDEMKGLYGTSLKAFVEKAISLELLDPELQNMDLDFLGNQIKPERDLLFSYLGLQTLYDRYFIHSDEIRFELPQVFFMRVAMGLAIAEEKREEKAVEFYNLLSSFDYMSSTPTLFNAGTKREQLASCFLLSMKDDSITGIYDTLKDCALISKYAGGIGLHVHNIRSAGSHIHGTNGISNGLLPMLRVYNETARYIDCLLYTSDAADE